MKIILQNTERIVDVNGIKSRLWEGVTEKGILIHCLIIRIAVNSESNHTEFEKELLSCSPPSAAGQAAFPVHLVV